MCTPDDKVAKAHKTHIAKSSVSKAEQKKTREAAMWSTVEAELKFNSEALLDVYMNVMSGVYRHEQAVAKVENPLDWLKPSRNRWSLLGTDDRRAILKKEMNPASYEGLTNPDHQKRPTEQKHEQYLIAYCKREAVGNFLPTQHQERLQDDVHQSNVANGSLPDVPIGARGMVLWSKKYGWWLLDDETDPAKPTLQHWSSPVKHALTPGILACGVRSPLLYLGAYSSRK